VIDDIKPSNQKIEDFKLLEKKNGKHPIRLLKPVYAELKLD